MGRVLRDDVDSWLGPDGEDVVSYGGALRVLKRDDEVETYLSALQHGHAHERKIEETIFQNE